MTIITHGSDLSLAPTLGPLVRQTGRKLAQVTAELAKAGFGAAQLDITLPGVRPRELSDTGRKDLRGMFARQGLLLAGLDLFIPRKDFVDEAKLDRAMAAALAGIELAGDLGRLPLSLPLPVKQMDTAARAQLVEAAHGRGVTLAVHAEEQLEDLAKWVEEVDLPELGIALDAAAAQHHAADDKPVDQLVHRYSKRLKVARLSDITDEGLRCAVGQGVIDLPMLRLALDLAQARRGPVVLDLRNMEHAWQAALAGKEAWDDAAMA